MKSKKRIFPKLLTAIFAYWMLSASMSANALQCSGKIIDIHKWHFHDNLSIMIEGANTWIMLPNKADVSMALTAYAMGKSVLFNWTNGATSCTNGWDPNLPFMGWWKIVH